MQGKNLIKKFVYCKGRHLKKLIKKKYLRVEKCSNFINNINILFDVIRIKSSDGLGRSCPKNFKFFNILKRGLHHSQKTHKETARREGKGRESPETPQQKNRLKKTFN